MERQYIKPLQLTHRSRRMTTLFDKFYDTNDGQIPSFNTCQHNIFIVALSEPEWCLATKNVCVMKEQYIK